MARQESLTGKLDWITVILYGILVLLGWVAIYSASYSGDEKSIFDSSVSSGKQFQWIVASTIILFIILIVDSRFYVTFSWIFYVLLMLFVALVPSLKAPKYEFKSVAEAVEMALTHEQKVTKAIYKIMGLAKEEGDHATEDFLRFFVDEQKEEEVQFKRILDKIKLIGGGPQSLYYIDKEFEKLSIAATDKKKKDKSGGEN